MTNYSSNYVSIIPRLIPSRWSSNQTIPMLDENDQIQNDFTNHYSSPTKRINSLSNNFAPLSTRTQLLSTNERNSSSHFNIPKERNLNSNGIYHEPLKDNSSGYESPYSRQTIYPINSFNLDPNISDSNLNSNRNQIWKILLIIFLIVVLLFSLTSLTISIYLLVRSSR